jgi:hypothetical protein
VRRERVATDSETSAHDPSSRDDAWGHGRHNAARQHVRACSGLLRLFLDQRK